MRTYDLVTTAPSIFSPVPPGRHELLTLMPRPGSVKQAIFVHYLLPEDMNPNDVWIVLTFTGPSAGHTVQDTGSPYEVQLAQVGRV